MGKSKNRFIRGKISFVDYAEIKAGNQHDSFYFGWFRCTFYRILHSFFFSMIYV